MSKGSGGGGRPGRKNSGGGSEMDARDLRSPGAKIGGAIQLMKENLASGKLDRGTAFAAYKSLLQQAHAYEREGEYGKAKVAGIRAEAINRAAGFLKK